MNDYKENTVGWWLSQLKEPLKSRALELTKEDETDEFLANSLVEAIDVIIDAHPWMEDTAFWRGVNDFFHGESQLDSEDEEGWDMAEKCAPDNWLKPNDGGEDKAIVDPPAPDVWGEKIPLGLFEGFNKGMDANTPLSKLSSEELLNLPTTPIEIGRKSPMQDWYDQLSPAREIEAPEPNEIPDMMTSKDELLSHGLGILGSFQKSHVGVEPAVVGYEIPKPIDTIEKKHELRIKNLEAYNKYQAERNQQIMDLNPHVDFCDSEGNLIRPSRMTALEARVIQLEGVVGKLEQQIEYVYRNLPKDFDGTR